MWLLKSFKIVVLKNGDQYPVINISPIKFDIICYILNKSFTSSSRVSELKEKIENLGIESLFIQAEDKCDIKITFDEISISGYFDEFEPFTLSTKEFKNILNEWYDFLIYYEEGNIPGIIPMNKKNEFIIVPNKKEI